MARRLSKWRLATILVTAVASILSTSVQSATPAASTGASPDVFAHAFLTDVSHVVDWGPMYERYQGSSETDTVWQELIAESRKVSSGAALEHVNSLFNRIAYHTDSAAWGKSDYWAAPAEFLTRGGDCEDFAIAKFLALRELGIPSSYLRIMVLRGETEGSDHAILMVETAAGPVILDNLRSDVYRLSSRLASRVAFAFNDVHMWIPRESFFATFQH
jgi:predicted transglutaminase-like cysteine proteinase